MEFSEKQLVDLLLDSLSNGNSEFHDDMKRHYSDFEKEHILPSGRKMDLFSNTGNRYFWIIEAKIHADANSIHQLFQYYSDVLISYKKSEISLFRLSIAAQFFNEQCLFFAEKLGVELIHIAPINQNSARILIQNQGVVKGVW